MTLSTTSNRIQYNGLTGQTVFAYNFKVNVKEDMSVYFDGVLQNDADWEISGLGNPAGGNVTLDVALAADTVITLLREVTLDQQTDYTAFDAFPAETHETALDDIVMMIQQLNEALTRVPGLPVDNDSGGLSLGNPVANQLVQYNAAADGLEASGQSLSDAGAVALAEVSGHQRAGNLQLIDGSQTYSSFSLTGQTGGIWVTVGPTGSGADVIWDALDNLPEEATAVVVQILGRVNPGSAAEASLTVYAAGGDAAAAPISSTNARLSLVADPDADTGDFGESTETAIPLGAGRIFRAAWTEVNSQGRLAVLYYRGFHADGSTTEGVTAPAAGGLWEELVAAAAPGAALATYQHTWNEDDYDEIKVVLNEVQPVNDATSFYLRLGHSDGATIFDQTNDYDSIERLWESTAAWFSGSDNNQHRLLASCGGEPGEVITGEIRILAGRGANLGVLIESKMIYVNSSGNQRAYETRSFLDTDQASIDTLQLYFASGNWENTGTIRVIGLKAAA